MIITHRLAAGIAVIGLYLTLLAHDSFLYLNLTLFHAAVLSLLRLFLIIFPVVCGFFIVKAKTTGARITYVLLWLFFLPYTIYSITEIRHVAEMCRLARGPYTDACVQNSWHLLPVAIYALAGTMAFMFTVMQVIPAFYRRSWQKRTVLLLLCLYTAFASVFGLYTRVNTWEIFVRPLATVKEILAVLALPGFASNVALFTLFFAGILFVGNRIIRQAAKYIQE